MYKLDLNSFGLVMQAGDIHPQNIGGELIAHYSDQDDERIPISNPEDSRLIQELLPKAIAGDLKATEKLAAVIKPYSPEVAKELLESIGKYDNESDPLIVQGDELIEGGEYTPPDMTTALEKYRQSAKNGNPCGMCRLGRSYAEGRGCYKNPKLAKYWLEKAAAQCEEADEYLDIYKLR